MSSFVISMEPQQNNTLWLQCSWYDYSVGLVWDQREAGISVWSFLPLLEGDTEISGYDVLSEIIPSMFFILGNSWNVLRVAEYLVVIGRRGGAHFSPEVSPTSPSTYRLYFLKYPSLQRIPSLTRSQILSILLSFLILLNKTSLSMELEWVGSVWGLTRTAWYSWGILCCVSSAEVAE